MGLKSTIEWTEATWNPVTGCTKISPGCKHCYAERMAERLQAMGQDNYRNGFRLTLQPHMLELPLRWKKPQTVFVNSMSDLFHEGVPLDYIQRVFAVMRDAHWHRFLARREEAVQLYDERFARMWEFYLASSEMSFRKQDLMNFQIQISKRQGTVPMTRDYIGNGEARLRNIERSERPQLQIAGE